MLIWLNKPFCYNIIISPLKCSHMRHNRTLTNNSLWTLAIGIPLAIVAQHSVFIISIQFIFLQAKLPELITKVSWARTIADLSVIHKSHWGEEEIFTGANQNPSRYIWLFASGFGIWWVCCVGDLVVCSVDVHQFLWGLMVSFDMWSLFVKGDERWVVICDEGLDFFVVCERGWDVSLWFVIKDSISLRYVKRVVACEVGVA